MPHLLSIYFHLSLRVIFWFPLSYESNVYHCLRTCLLWLNLFRNESQLLINLASPLHSPPPPPGCSHIFRFFFLSLLSIHISMAFMPNVRIYIQHFPSSFASLCWKGLNPENILRDSYWARQGHYLIKITNVSLCHITMLGTLLLSR